MKSKSKKKTKKKKKNIWIIFSKYSIGLFSSF